MKKSAALMLVLFIGISLVKLSCSSYVGNQFNEEKPAAVKEK